MDTKTCTRCGEEKHFESFTPTKKNKTGRTAQCRDCRNSRLRERYASDSDYRARSREKDAEFRNANRERLNLEARKRYARDGEAHRERSRAWYHANKEMASDRRKRCAEKNRERLNESNRRWRSENPDLVRAFHEKYVEANREKRSAHIAAGNAIRSGKLQKKPCVRCGSTDNIEAHHWSYEEEHWLDVTWLCRKCHVRAHKIIRARAEYHLEVAN